MGVLEDDAGVVQRLDDHRFAERFIRIRHDVLWWSAVDSIIC